MKVKLQTLFCSLFIMFGLSLAVVAPAGVQAAEELCQGANLSLQGGAGDCGAGASEGKLDKLIKGIVNVFTVIVGIVAVIMIIYAGFRFITSGGDANAVSSARNTILYAIVGLVIVALAQVIVRFIIGKATN